MPSYLDVAFWYSGWDPTRWPTADEVQAIAANFPVSVWKEQVYDANDYFPPYTVPAGDVDDIRFVIAGAKAAGMTICPYTSWFYAANAGAMHAETDYTADQYLAEVRRLKNQLGANGIYVDGMMWHYGASSHYDLDANRYVASELRKIVGLGGKLILHATHIHLAGTRPPSWETPDLATECFFDLIVLGEDPLIATDGDVRAAYQTEQVDPRLAAGQKIAFVTNGQLLAVANPNVVSAYGIVTYGGGVYTDGTTGNYDAVIAARV